MFILFKLIFRFLNDFNPLQYNIYEGDITHSLRNYRIPRYNEDYEISVCLFDRNISPAFSFRYTYLPSQYAIELVLKCPRKFPIVRLTLQDPSN